jgi:hypothetical protein
MYMIASSLYFWSFFMMNDIGTAMTLRIDQQHYCLLDADVHQGFTPFTRYATDAQESNRVRDLS